MFDLERAIALWRRQMAGEGIQEPAVLDELESHLRDEIGSRMRDGLNERTAFQLAAEQVGGAEALKREFAKDRPDLRRWFVVAFVALYSAVTGGAALLKLGGFSEITSAQQFSALAAVMITGLLVLGGPVVARILPVIRDKRTKITTYGIGIASVLIWLSVFYRYAMTRAEWDTSHLVVALLWSWLPMAALCGMIFGVEHAARIHMRRSDV